MDKIKFEDIDFAARCLFARKKSGKTQMQIANELKINQGGYNRYEKGTVKNRNRQVVDGIAEACGVSEIWLEYGLKEYAPENFNDSGPSSEEEQPDMGIAA